MAKPWTCPHVADAVCVACHQLLAKNVNERQQELDSMRRLLEELDRRRDGGAA